MLHRQRGLVAWHVGTSPGHISGEVQSTQAGVLTIGLALRRSIISSAFVTLMGWHYLLGRCFYCNWARVYTSSVVEFRARALAIVASAPSSRLMFSLASTQAGFLAGIHLRHQLGRITRRPRGFPRQRATCTRLPEQLRRWPPFVKSSILMCSSTGWFITHPTSVLYGWRSRNQAIRRVGASHGSTLLTDSRFSCGCSWHTGP